MSEGPLAAYRAKLAAGELKPDPAQHLAAEKLQSLHHALRDYRPALGQSGWLARFGLGRNEPQSRLPWHSGDGVSVRPRQGLYIFGEVGRGKSMLMDLFFETATIAGKQRVHFHEFMRDVHKEVHQWRQTPGRKETDPLPKLARGITSSAWLLCLDELQILDIADAMIVGRLFQALLDNGTVIVVTSNRPPDDLYKDGLQRDRFLPFIGLIKERLDILELNSEQDYRLGRKRGLRVFHTPLGREAERDLDASFARLTGGRTPRPASITVHERAVTVPAAVDGIARFTFDELCARPLGPSDYLALATHFHTLVVSGIPRLGPQNRNEAKRFVTLIDALYEHKATLVCSAAAPPEELYPSGDGAFEFQRTVSRLIEMQSEEYLAREHLT
ncbi:MAG: cell division protein ZapE [Rhodospirillales bacterium]|nr:cell division protein ZapE [Rhodospirillales bacterium]